MPAENLVQHDPIRKTAEAQAQHQRRSKQGIHSHCESNPKVSSGVAPMFS
jgi:hypothetical protein